jgi:hypothetical protein
MYPADNYHKTMPGVDSSMPMPQGRVGELLAMKDGRFGLGFPVVAHSDDFVDPSLHLGLP